MAGVLRAKAVEEARTVGDGAIGSVNIQPPVGKVWWFKALRYAISLKHAETGSGTHAAASNLTLRRAGAVTITEREWSTTTRVNGSFIFGEPLLESGELTQQGLVATNAVYLQLAWVIGDSPSATASNYGSGQWSLTWIGVEADLI